MFNIGPLEILTVLVIALVVVGPKRLPELARTIGRGLNEFRKIQDEVKDMVKFDLGADLLGEDDEPVPNYDMAHPEPEPEAPVDDEITDDGMTHSERVVAALPDEEETVGDGSTAQPPDGSLDEPLDEGPAYGAEDGVAALPAVAASTGARDPETLEDRSGSSAEPPAEEPPAAAAE
jgi:Tat protein translocase TatB subunit